MIPAVSQLAHLFATMAAPLSVAQLRPGGNPHRAEDFECRVPEG
jgi:hypothetical protein